MGMPDPETLRDASFGTGGGIRTDLCTPPERSFTVGYLILQFTHEH